jgi:predicted small secreted protein
MKIFAFANRRVFFERQKGASLLEALSYLSIATLVIVGTTWLISQAFSSANATRAIQEVYTIRNNIKKFYMGRGNNSYGIGDMTVSLYDAGIFPPTLPYNAHLFAMRNEWGGRVVVIGGTKTYNIQYTDIPQPECIEMVSGATGWVSVGSHSTIIAHNPITLSDAIAICSDNTSNGNTIDFKSN